MKCTAGRTGSKRRGQWTAVWRDTRCCMTVQGSVVQGSVPGVGWRAELQAESMHTIGNLSQLRIAIQRFIDFLFGGHFVAPR